MAPPFLLQQVGIMAKLNIPLKYLDIDSLKERWNVNNSVLIELAKEENLKFFIRPIVLEMALGTTTTKSKLYDRALELLNRTPVRLNDVYQLLAKKSQFITIKNICKTEKDIQIDLADLVVPMANIETIEQKYSERSQRTNTFVPVTDDCSCVLFNGKEYTFGVMQAKVIKILWDSYNQGTPWVYGKRILSQIGCGSDRIQSLFSHNKHWRNVVASDGNGKYRLDVPAKPKSVPNAQNNETPTPNIKKFCTPKIGDAWKLISGTYS